MSGRIGRTSRGSGVPYPSRAFRRLARSFGKFPAYRPGRHPQALSLIGGFFATNMIDAIKALWKMKDSNEGYVKGVSSSLNFRQQKALEYLQGTNVMGNDDYQRINKVSDSTAQSELNDLLKKEFIRRVGRTRGIRYIL